MFARAVERASAFTLPYLGLRRRADGEVHTVISAFVVINDEGWIATAGHVIDDIMECDRQQEALASGEVEDEQRAALTDRHTEIWAVPGFAHTRPRLVEARVNRTADLAVGRIDPAPPPLGDALPRLRDTDAEPLAIGEAVCRLGFPFHVASATWSAERDEFEVAAEAFPVPQFALDGVISRFSRHTGPEDSSAMFIETSTPGLRGQSGGPLFDTKGRVCGLQSQTAHFDLGFDARYVDEGGALVVERQFLNVGVATHVDELAAALLAQGASFRRE